MPREKWSTEIIRTEALKYNSPSEFYKACEGAYSAARRKGILDEVCAHMVRKTAKHYTEQEVRDAAAKCSTTNEFLKMRSIVDYARRNGIYADVTSHMRRLVPSDTRVSNGSKRTWTIEMVQTLADNYSAVGDFRQNEPKAYDAAHRHGWITTVTSHMTYKTKRFDMAVYASETADRNIRPLSVPARCDTKVIHECLVCGTNWIAQPWRVVNEKTGCPRCARGNVSGAEQRLIDWIETLGVNLIRSDRTVARPFEVDGYVAEHSLAIEFNGMYWHSIKEPDYHLNKTVLCERKGVRLIHVWEHEKDCPIIRSIIRTAVRSHDHVVRANKCQVRQVEWSEAKAFLESNHVQGAGMRTKCNLALVHEGVIVALMTFAHPRFKPILHDWELVRYAVKLNTCVTGGSSRLWSKRPSGSVVTYSDRRLFDGKMYERLGFTRQRESKPGYFYVGRKGEVLQRYDTRREKLPVLLGEKFNPYISETKNMLAAGYYRLWDCGTVTWSYRP